MQVRDLQAFCSVKADQFPACTEDQIVSKFAPIGGGHCNNVRHPIWGNRNQPFRRLLQVCNRDIFTTRDALVMRNGQLDDVTVDREKEADEVSVVRQDEAASGEKSVLGVFKPLPGGSFNCDTGHQLPNARLVSRTIHLDQDVPSRGVNHFFPIFGQFVAHDFILTGTQNADTSCCTSPAVSVYANCLPIIVPQGDEFFGAGHCLDFKRATVYCNRTDNHRQHVNQLSAFIDAENLYGVDPATGNALRN